MPIWGMELITIDGDTGLVIDDRHRRDVMLTTRTRTGHTVRELVSAWLGEAADSENTRAAYQADLDEYLAWCVRRGLDPLTVRLPEVTMYGVERASTPSPRTGKPLSPKTRARKLAAVSSWYTYLVRSGTLDANPARDARRPKYDRRHSPTSSVNGAQATAMKDAAAGTEHRTIGRPCIVLILALMIDLGIRVSEVCGIDMDDLGQRDGMRTLTVHMKGAKVRTRPVPVQLAPLLDTWLGARKPAPGHEDALLLTTNGQRVNRFQVYRLVQRMAALAGVPAPKRITPHSMRHTFNTIARKRGAALEDRRDALGHSSAAITQLYDHVALSLAGDPAHLVSAATAQKQTGMDL